MDLTYIESENLAFRTVSDCKNAIAVRNWATTLMIAVPHAQNQGVLNEIMDRMPKRATVADPTLLRKLNTEADRQKTVRVSRGATPY